MLKIINLHAKINDIEVLRGINLTVNAGETHAIMGPNGSGKSTLSKIIAGHPNYEVTSGEILYEINGTLKNLLVLSPDERAKEGIFLAQQYPVEIPGISNLSFLYHAFSAISEHHGAQKMSESEFRKYVEKKLQVVLMKADFLDRGVNVGFSGGEKKRNEILQMAVLSPRLSFLDETDSGLDIDALKIVAGGVNQIKNKDNALVLVTHYQRLLDYIIPDFVHVLSEGKIIETGDKSLAHKLESRGYDWLVK